jgi:ribonuclease E
MASEQGKPRKRPSDMKRGEPPRRRRNRGRKPESEGLPAMSTAEPAEAMSELIEPRRNEAEPALPLVAGINDGVIAASVTPAGHSEGLEMTTPEPLVSVRTDEGWAHIPDSAESTIGTPPTTVTPSAPKQPVTETVVAVEVPSTAGITARGRACNDPRVEARPVGVVEITTSYKSLFSEYVAPPATSSTRIVPRASNDPRGPRPTVIIAHAAGQA